MQIKLRNIVESHSALVELSSLKLRASASFNIVKLLRKINEELQDFTKVRDDKIKEYSIPDSSENIEKFNEDINALLEKDITIDVAKLRLEDLGNAEISVGSLLALQWLLED